MSGRLIKVIPKTQFDFSGVDVGATTATIPLGDPVDVTEFANIGIAIRVHAAVIDIDNFVQVNIYEDGFLDGSSAAFPGAYGNGISLAHGEAAPGVRFAYYEMLGQFATIGIRAANGTVSPGMNVTLSIDAYLRDANETRNVVRYGVASFESDEYVGSPGSSGWSGAFPAAAKSSSRSATDYRTKVGAGAPQSFDIANTSGATRTHAKIASALANQLVAAKQGRMLTATPSFLKRMK
jgi:hypothetical protein